MNKYEAADPGIARTTCDQCGHHGPIYLAYESWWYYCARCFNEWTLVKAEEK